MYIFDGLLLFITRKRLLKVKIIQNLSGTAFMTSTASFHQKTLCFHHAESHDRPKASVKLKGQSKLVQNDF